MKHHFFYITILLCCFQLANAQQKTYKVGYKAISTYDKTRKEISSNTFLKSTEVKNPYRPILIHVWYPTTESLDAKKMSERDYHFTVEDFDKQIFTNKSQRDSIEKVYLTRLTNVKPNSSELFRKKTSATKNAKSIDRTFPLIIHASYVQAQWEYHELLASKGNIVMLVNVIDEPYGNISSARDIEFGVKLLHNNGFSFDKIIGIGSGYGSENIYSFQMTSNLLDGFISYDGSEHWTGRAESYKKTFQEQYNIRKMNIPYVRFYDHDPKRADSTFVQRMKYADQYLLDMKAEFVNHGSFQYPHSIYNHLNPKKHKAMLELLDLKVDLTTQFIDFVKGKNSNPIPKSMENDKRITIKHIPALKMPPTKAELKTLMQQLGAQKLDELIVKNHKKDEDFLSYKDLYEIIYELIWSTSEKYKEHIPYFNWATTYFPNKQSVYIQLIYNSFFNKNLEMNTKYRTLLLKAIEKKKIILTERDQTNLKRFTL